jgi:hypothetical protein
MKRLLFLTTVLAGAAVVLGRILPPERRESISQMRESMRGRMRERMMERMRRIMEEMPDDSPPKLVMSTLPRLQEQNDQILALLREQNDLLRERLPEPESS